MASTESNDSTATSTGRSISTGLIKLKPISALLCDDSSSIASQFAFGENSISDPVCEVSQPHSWPTVVLERIPEQPLIRSVTSEDVTLLSDTECEITTDPLAIEADTKPEVKVPIKSEVPPVFLTPTITPTKRKFKKKLTGNYHKLTDFFTPRSCPGKENVSGNTKEEKKGDPVTPSKVSNTKPVTSTNTSSSPPSVPSITVTTTDDVPQFKDTKSSQPVTRFEVRRKLCMGTDLRKVSNRYHGEDQMRMDKFIDREEGMEGCSYFSTYESSHFPVSICGDMADVDKVVDLLGQEDGKELLDIRVEEGGKKNKKKCILIDLKQVPTMEKEEPPKDMSQGDQKKKKSPKKEEELLQGIRSVLRRLSDSSVDVVEQRLSSSSGEIKRSLSQVTNNNNNEVEKMEQDDVISISSSISDPEDSQFVPEKVTEVKKKGRGRPKGTTTKATTAKTKNIKKSVTPKKGPRGRSSKVVCPEYKIVKGTKFAVDAFRFGSIDTVTNYFLTHFHSDHYVGLKKDFAHPIYMSTITANLVRKIIKVQEEFIHAVELNSPVVIDGVEVTALDANQ